MGHQRRYYQHHSVCMITNRLAEGLPFVPNDFINALLIGALARASARNPGIVICSYTFLQNHYHLVVFINTDELEMASFLHDLDDEIAKITKKILGKRNVKIWAQRPHVAVIGDFQAVINQIAYSLLNAVTANFCRKASEWIGLTSFPFLFDQTPTSHKWVRTGSIGTLPNAPFSKRSVNRLKLHWENSPGKYFTLSVQPYCWKGQFSESRNISDEQLLDRILTQVAEGELLAEKIRKKEKCNLCNTQQLALQNPHKQYKPKKYGRRVYCICTDPELRKQMIALYSAFCTKCADVWTSWRRGNLSAKYPPGAFIPSRSPLASLLPEPYFPSP